MIQLVNDLLLRHNGLSLNPLYPLKKLYILICACNLSTARRHRKVPRVCWPEVLTIWMLQNDWEVLSQRVMWKAIEKDTQHWPLASIYMPVYIYIQCIHTKKRSQAIEGDMDRTWTSSHPQELQRSIRALHSFTKSGDHASGACSSWLHRVDAMDGLKS